MYQHRFPTSTLPTACCVAALIATLVAPQAHGNGPTGATHVWQRVFEPPSVELPITLDVGGGSFSASTPTLGQVKAPGRPLFDDDTACNITTLVTPQPTGYDITYTIHNPTSVMQNLPTLYVDGHLMAEDVIEFLDHRFGCSFNVFDDSDHSGIACNEEKYPLTLFAPIMVIRDSEKAIGFSIMYPVLEYQKQVKMTFKRDELQDVWYAVYWLKGKIDANESLTYKVAVRYTLRDDWIHTLEDYRAYFWDTYGDEPTYVQDMRPVGNTNVSDVQWLAPDNPKGYEPNLRPDLFGWQQNVTASLNYAATRGFERYMARCPSGMYYENVSNNFPPQMSSCWNNKLKNTADEWQRFNQAGIELYFWWGNSAKIADQWDDPEHELFDTTNSDHRKAMRKEFKGIALPTNADGFGLDAFELMTPWGAIEWLENLRIVKPGTFFVAEPLCSDILLMHVPVWMESVHLQDPNLLADYLVPGREMWVNVYGEDANADRIAELVSWGATISMGSTDWTAPPIMEMVNAELEANAAMLAQNGSGGGSADGDDSDGGVDIIDDGGGLAIEGNELSSGPGITIKPSGSTSD